jgi:hypothetical protein
MLGVAMPAPVADSLRRVKQLLEVLQLHAVSA